MRAVAFVLLLQACYTVRFVSPELHSIPDGTVLHTWTHSFFWGFVPSGKASIDQCGYAGVKEMKSQIGGLGLVASVLTLGVWTPMHVKIVCADAPRHVEVPPTGPRPPEPLVPTGPLL